MPAKKKAAKKKAKAAPKKARAVKAAENPCGCGCGTKVRREFAQGHDSKAKSMVKAWKAGDLAKTKLPAVLQSRAGELAKRWGY